MKLKLVTLIIVVFLFTVAHATASIVFYDDFENGNLDNWIIGGRQLGTHTANVVTSDTGSLCGHLYQRGAFSEINISQNFSFDPNDSFYFDMKVNVSSTTPPASNYFGISGVTFNFLDQNDSILGSVWYIASTTDYPSTNWVIPSRSVNVISENVWHNFELDTLSLLSQITVDQAEIMKTQMLFETYSSTWPWPTVTAELWVDNVSNSPVPIPGAVWLLVSGLAGLVGTRIRRKKK